MVLPRHIATFGMAFLVATCGTAHTSTTGSPSAVADRGSVQAGHYSGDGTDIAQVSFDVDQQGSVSNFTGWVGVRCAEGVASGVNNFHFDDSSGVTLAADGSFSGSYDDPGTGGIGLTLTYAGQLSSSGGATGTLSIASQGCAARPVPGRRRCRAPAGRPSRSSVPRPRHRVPRNRVSSSAR